MIASYDTLEALIHDTKLIVLSAVRKNLNPVFWDSIDDVVQETYIRAYRALQKGKFRGDSTAGTWLYTIARNESLRLNEKRKREEEKMLRVIELKKYQAPETDTQDKFAVDRIAAMQVIDELPSKYGDVLKLYIAGHSEHEIAEHLNIKVGTVKSRTSRGKEMIARIMHNGTNKPKTQLLRTTPGATT